MADFSAAYGDMDAISAELKSAQQDIHSQLTSLKSKVDDLTNSGFKTQVASGKFADGYSELTNSLSQALEGISTMGEGLSQMRQKIEELDHQLAGS